LYIKYKVLLFYSGASIGLLISQSLFPGYLFEISGDPGGEGYPRKDKARRKRL